MHSRIFRKHETKLVITSCIEDGGEKKTFEKVDWRHVAFMTKVVKRIKDKN
jgi:hypothetical protein